MVITKGKPEVGKWWISFTPFGKNSWRIDPIGWRVFRMIVIKLKRDPYEGEAFNKDMYDGFTFSFSYWLPFDRA